MADEDGWEVFESHEPHPRSRSMADDDWIDAGGSGGQTSLSSSVQSFKSDGGSSRMSAPSIVEVPHDPPPGMELFITADSFLLSHRSGNGSQLVIDRQSGEFTYKAPGAHSRPFGALERTIAALFGVFLRQHEAFLAVVSEAQNVVHLSGGNIFSVSKVSVWHSVVDPCEYADQFFINKEVILDLVALGEKAAGWIAPMIQGSVTTVVVSETPVPIQSAFAHPQYHITLVSRRSRMRAWPLNLTGLDEDGYSADFVEAEQILELGGIRASFISCRGSWPVVWEKISGTGAVCVKVASEAGSQMLALAQHLRRLASAYSKVNCVSLLTSRVDENNLSKPYDKAFKDAKEHLGQIGTAVTSLQFKGGSGGFTMAAMATAAKEMKPRCGISSKGGSGGSSGVEERKIDSFCRFHAWESSDAIAMQAAVSREALISFFDLVAADRPNYGTLPESWEGALTRLWALPLAKGSDGGASVQGSRHKTYSSLSSWTAGAAKAMARSLGPSDSQSSETAAQLLLRLHALGKKAHRAWKIHAEMFKQQQSLWRMEQRNLFVGCWNVKGDLYGPKDVKGWLKSAITELGDKGADMYVLGLQEAVELGVGSVLKDTGHGFLGALGDVASLLSDEPAKEASSKEHAQSERKAVQAWQGVIEDAMKSLHASSNRSFELIASRQLVGVLVFVYASKELLPKIKNVVVETCKTGLGGMAGNKGGVAVRFTLNYSTLSFICAHMAAHQKQVGQRNTDYNTIMNSISFPGSQPPVYPKRIKEAIEKGAGAVLPPDCFGHDQVFFYGDLNYRIDHFEGDDIVKMTKKKQFAELEAQDQLRKEQKAGRALFGMTEGKLSFPPTYKFVPGSEEYSDPAKRSPAWCDRILWRGDGITNVLYTSIPDVLCSDHRPVVAVFKLDIRAAPKSTEEVDKICADAAVKVDKQLSSRPTLSNRNQVQSIKKEEASVSKPPQTAPKSPQTDVEKEKRGSTNSGLKTISEANLIDFGDVADPAKAGKNEFASWDPFGVNQAAAPGEPSKTMVDNGGEAPALAGNSTSGLSLLDDLAGLDFGAATAPSLENRPQPVQAPLALAEPKSRSEDLANKAADMFFTANQNNSTPSSTGTKGMMSGTGNQQGKGGGSGDPFADLGMGGLKFGNKKP